MNRTNEFQKESTLTNLNGDEMALSEHIEEFSQRFLFCILVLVFSTLICFANISEIVKVFQAPAIGVKFLQFSPGEYFFASIKIAVFVGLLISSPIILYQIFLYVVPGMTRREQNIILPITLSSVLLFGTGLWFAYFFLVPAALQFFIKYGYDVVEPFWSFDQYFDFIALLIFTTGLAFQVPIIQVGLGFFGIVSSQMMLTAWKYVVVVAIILAAILTPSTDPVTQIIMASALLLLYLGGIGVVFILGK